MERLTDMEKECKELLLFLIDVLAPGRSHGRHDYTELMNRIRKAYFRLESKEYGCATGKHVSACACPKEG